MGKATKQQMEQNRQNIILSSSRLFKQHGLDGVSLNDIMSSVGLTHGGFYRHFKSKDELENLACEHAFQSPSPMGEKYQFTRLQDLIEVYLSPEHRDNPVDGCSVAALVADVQRKEADKAVRQEYLAGVKKTIKNLQDMAEDPQPGAESDALAQLAMMTGALMLARATSGDDISLQFLEAAKRALLSQ